MSQKLKAIWQTVWSKASSISQMWKLSRTEGQGPAKSTQWGPGRARLELRAPALRPASFLHPGISSGEALVSPAQRSGPHIPAPSLHSPSSHETLGSVIPDPTGGLPDQPSSLSLSSPRETGHHTSPFLGLRCGPGTQRCPPPPPRPPPVWESCLSLSQPPRLTVCASCLLHLHLGGLPFWLLTRLAPSQCSRCSALWRWSKPQLPPSYTVSGNVQPLWRTVCSSLKKLKIELPCVHAWFDSFQPIWSSNPTPQHIFRENCNSKRYMLFNICSSTIYNSQEIEAT